MAQYDINLREYWRILKKRKFIVILTALVLGVFTSFFAIIRAPTPLYTSVCSIKFEREATVEGLYAQTISWSESDDIETQISVIKSFMVFKEVGKKMGLIPAGAISEEGNLDSNFLAVIDSLQSKVDVTREEFTNILNISVTDGNPAFAQTLANRIALTYKELHAKKQLKRTKEAIKYIGEQLQKVRQKLRESEEEFNRFTQENQLVSIDLQSENLLNRTQEIQSKIRELKEEERELRALGERLKQFIKKPSAQDDSFYTVKANAQYQATNDNLVELQLKKDTMLEDYTPQHPEVITVSRKIIENARKMSMLLDLQVKELGRKEVELRRELEKVGQKTHLLMERKLEYDRLKRKVELNNDMMVLLEKKSQEALIRKADKPEEISIVKPALLPGAPINPPKKLATGITGLIIGLILGTVVAFVVETFDTSLGAIEDVEETLGTQVLGIIPDADEKDIHESLKGGDHEGIEESIFQERIHLISHFAPKSMMAESFRALRTNIQFKGKEQPIKTLLITSTSPQEGKTLASVNVAITMAQAGLKTLLVEADLRRPMLAKVFGVEIIPGLTDILLGNHPWRDTIKSITDMMMGKMGVDDIMMTPGLDNLNFITSGSLPPNPAELIDSKRLEDFIEEAKDEYDFIILDTPPILSTADSTILGAKVDGVLLVYRVGTVSRGLLKRSSNQLEQVKANILGVILNGMKPEISPDFQDFKYYKYYYGTREEGKEKRGHLKGGGKKLNAFSLFLIFMALAFLGIGILWQNGIIDPFQWAGLDMRDQRTEPKDSINKGPSAPPPEQPPVEEKGPISPPVPATKIEETTAPSLLAEESPTYPYSIYLGAFRTAGRAEKAIGIYKEDGLSPYWVKVDLGEKGEWFRVYTGYFEDREKAEKVVHELGLQDYSIKRTQYATLIDLYPPDMTNLEDQIINLKRLGYSPYVVKDQKGDSRLFVGAFLTKAGAESLYNDLRSKGIQSEVVER